MQRVKISAKAQRGEEDSGLVSRLSPFSTVSLEGQSGRETVGKGESGEAEDSLHLLHYLDGQRRGERVWGMERAGGVVTSVYMRLQQHFLDEDDRLPASG